MTSDQYLRRYPSIIEIESLPKFKQPPWWAFNGSTSANTCAAVRGPSHHIDVSIVNVQNTYYYHLNCHATRPIKVANQSLPMHLMHLIKDAFLQTCLCVVNVFLGRWQNKVNQTICDWQCLVIWISELNLNQLVEFEQFLPGEVAMALDVFTRFAHGQHNFCRLYFHFKRSGSIKGQHLRPLK